MKQATLIAPDSWTVLNPSQKNAFIEAEFGDGAGRNILAAATKNGVEGVFALLDYRQIGYIDSPSIAQINEQNLVAKINEDLQMLNQENGFSETEKVRWKGFVLKPRFDEQHFVLDYGVEMQFGHEAAVNLYRMQLLRDGVLVLTLVGMPKDQLNFNGWQYQYDKTWNYQNYQASRDLKAEGTLANVMLMNRFI